MAQVNTMISENLQDSALNRAIDDLKAWVVDSALPLSNEIIRGPVLSHFGEYTEAVIGIW